MIKVSNVIVYSAREEEGLIRAMMKKGCLVEEGEYTFLIYM